MYISKVKIVTKESVDKLKEYRKGNYLKYDDINYKYVNVYKILADDKDCFKGIVFSCSCSNLFTMSTSKLSYNFTYSEIESINCGCVQIKRKKILYRKLKELITRKRINPLIIHIGVRIVNLIDQKLNRRVKIHIIAIIVSS